MKILDAGCGYGRISLPLGQKFPQAQISGMDISPNYLRIYRQNTGRDAFIGTVEAIPPQIGTFDYIIVVTVLMYLPENKLKEAFSCLFAHLNPDGKIILIEPDRSGIAFSDGMRADQTSAQRQQYQHRRPLFLCRGNCRGRQLYRGQHHQGGAHPGNNFFLWADLSADQNSAGQLDAPFLPGAQCPGRFIKKYPAAHPVVILFDRKK